MYWATIWSFIMGCIVVSEGAGVLTSGRWVHCSSRGALCAPRGPEDRSSSVTRGHATNRTRSTVSWTAVPLWDLRRDVKGRKDKERWSKWRREEGNERKRDEARRWERGSADRENFDGKKMIEILKERKIEGSEVVVKCNQRKSDLNSQCCAD